MAFLIGTIFSERSARHDKRKARTVEHGETVAITTGGAMSGLEDEAERLYMAG